MLAALQEFEAGLGSHGLPLAETTSTDGDPDRPGAKYHYEVRVMRDWAQDAVEARKKDFDDDSRARLFLPYRVDH